MTKLYAIITDGPIRLARDKAHAENMFKKYARDGMTPRVLLMNSVTDVTGDFE